MTSGTKLGNSPVGLYIVSHYSLQLLYPRQVRYCFFWVSKKVLSALELLRLMWKLHMRHILHTDERFHVPLWFPRKQWQQGRKTLPDRSGSISDVQEQKNQLNYKDLKFKYHGICAVLLTVSPKQNYNVIHLLEPERLLSPIFVLHSFVLLSFSKDSRRLGLISHLHLHPTVHEDGWHRSQTFKDLPSPKKSH